MNWQPSATLTTLQARAAILKSIRDFFYHRHVLEVETPALCRTTVTDPHIASIPAIFQTQAGKQIDYYLQTSPEYAMKRLLANGSGSIFQIAKAFRQGEIGPHHNPEFTMLEWYRTGFDHHALMNEVDDLLQLILQTAPAERLTYADAFQRYLHIDVHQVTLAELKQCANQHTIFTHDDVTDRDVWLQLLMSQVIENNIGQDQPCFIYDYPVSQAALSRIQATNPPVASRFEVYFKGLELANGYHELTSAEEQRRRFEKNLAIRKQLQLPLPAIDEHLLAALTFGLPDCAGVALGIDRLIMLAADQPDITRIMSFDFSRVS